MALTREEREQFLAEPHVGGLSVAAGPDRGPLSVPLWYVYEPGGELWILTPADSRKAKLIEAAGCFSLLAERTTPSVRYVSVEGPVTRTAPGSDEHLVRISSRYLSDAALDGYLDFARAELGAQVVIHMRPRHWLSADLGS